MVEDCKFNALINRNKDKTPQWSYNVIASNYQSQFY